MNVDPTVPIRQKMVADQQAEGPLTREALEARHGKVWTTDELREEFDVQGFGAPLCVVRRKSDGKVGSVMFQHSPRFYYEWKEN